MEEKKLPLIVLTGPTSVGKTALSIKLAKAIHGEIISADSMQVYRRMNIGTAKIRPEEMDGVVHHLIDICEPWEDYNVVLFAQRVKKLIPEIIARGNVPMLVGGTGFYIQSVLYDIDFTETKEDTAFREELFAFAEKMGENALHQRLREIDPEAAEAIHPNNVKKVVRAIEFATQTGNLISEHNKTQRRKDSAYNSLYFVLMRERELLYQRIEERIDEMVEEGLVGEVKSLLDEGCKEGMVSMQGLGYKEILSYLRGECSLEEAIVLLKRNTRRFAKRQITWYKREKDVISFDKGSYKSEEDILNEMLVKIHEKGIGLKA